LAERLINDYKCNLISDFCESSRHLGTVLKFNEDLYKFIELYMGLLAFIKADVTGVDYAGPFFKEFISQKNQYYAFLNNYYYIFHYLKSHYGMEKNYYKHLLLFINACVNGFSKGRFFGFDDPFVREEDLVINDGISNYIKDFQEIVNDVFSVRLVTSKSLDEFVSELTDSLKNGELDKLAKLLEESEK
jgi:hypothetical protein